MATFLANEINATDSNLQLGVPTFFSGGGKVPSCRERKSKDAWSHLIQIET